LVSVAAFVVAVISAAIIYFVAVVITGAYSKSEFKNLYHAKID
jgi:hypothetical protein